MKNTFMFQLPIKNIFILQYIEKLLDVGNIGIFFTTNSTVIFQIFLSQTFASVGHYFQQFEIFFENYVLRKFRRANYSSANCVLGIRKKFT